MNRLQFSVGIYALGFAATALMMTIVALIAPQAPGGGFIVTPAAMGAIYVTQLLPTP
jgi:hypothetical protein